MYPKSRFAFIYYYAESLDTGKYFDEDFLIVFAVLVLILRISVTHKV